MVYVKAVAACLVVVSALASCAGVKPQLNEAQQRTYELFDRCKHETRSFNVDLMRVSPEGVPYLTAVQTATDMDRVLDCMYGPGNWRK